MDENKEYIDSQGSRVIEKPDGTKITYSTSGRAKHKRPKRKAHKKYLVLVIILLSIAGGVAGTVAYIKYHNHQIWLAQQPKCSHPSVKGNISYTTGVKIYHMPWDSDYDKTVIDTSSGERWFCTAKEAEAAGWRHTQAY